MRLNARWRAAKGIPANIRLGEGKGTRDGPSVEAVEEWKRDLDRIEQAVTRKLKAGYQAMRKLILDDQAPWPAPQDDCQKALTILAIQMGQLADLGDQRLADCA